MIRRRAGRYALQRALPLTNFPIRYRRRDFNAFT